VEQRLRIEKKLKEAGVLKPDIVCFTEMCTKCGVSKEVSYIGLAETVPEGPTCHILSEYAREYGMYVLAGIIEKRGRYIFNTAVLFDRKGKFIGQYDKTHLTFGELVKGLSCGEGYPVFDLDFGRIGIQICYDEWFPEVTRYYAHKGVEILFLPVIGGKPITWRTRALDNGFYFVSASKGPPSMIIDSSGAILSEIHDDGIAYADLNLDYRKVNWYGDPTWTQGMPTIVRQMRHCLDDKYLEKLFNNMTDK
jgi:predicted amidohydrolase